ncbi:MAG: leucine-rich repeat domain-containing protein [Aureispira sp.]|nr:leucine-rich repeat domain-containing protein [Aureispira sp.]
MEVQEFTNYLKAKNSSAKAIRLKVNLVQSSKHMEAIFSLPNLIELELTDKNRVGVLPDSIGGAQQLKSFKLRRFVGKELPKELFSLANLESLSLVECHYAKWPTDDWTGLRSLKNLNCFRSINAFPKGVLAVANIESIEINYCDWRRLPPQISKLQRLERLFIWATQMKITPTSLVNLSNLRDLTLMHVHIPLSSWIGKLTQLKKLTLSPRTVTGEMPESLFELRGLEELNFFNFIKELNPNIGKLKSLKKLNLRRNLLESLPDELSKLVSLEELDIEFNNLRRLPGCIAVLPKLKVLKFREQQVHNSELNIFQKFLDWLKKESPTPKERSIYTAIWDKKELNPSELDIWLLFRALWSMNKTLAINAIYYLTEVAVTKYRPLKRGDELYLLAKTSRKKTAIKQKLKEVGITTSNKISPKTTHILIDERSDLNATKVLVNKWSLMTEGQLDDYLNKIAPEYLLEESESGAKSAMAAKVLELIYSMDSNNIDLALGMLKGGGVPDEMVTGLFAINKLSDNPKQRAQARKFLKQIASEELLVALSKRVNFRKCTHAYDFDRAIVIYEQTEIDLEQFALLFYKAIEYGNSYNNDACRDFISGSGRRAIILEYFKMHVNKNKGRLQFSHSAKMIEDIVPKEIFELENITQLEFLTKAPEDLNDFCPKELENLKTLKKLKFFFYGRSVGRITKAPKLFSKLTSLEQIECNILAPSFSRSLKAVSPNCKIVGRLH